MMAGLKQQNFSTALLKWFEIYGRHDLPWQHPRSAYRVWVSEIMLQQTQVKTVIPYFNRFLASFPDVITLAMASDDEVLAHWSGLGYYSRARNLHKTAKIIHTEFKGIFPSDVEDLAKLPGIGPSTAAAIASLAFNEPTAILDGNVKRVLSRYFLVAGELKQATVHHKLWQLAKECMPQKNCAKYTQAIMDLGATCCTLKNPDCSNCPLNTTCLAKKEDVVTNYPTKNSKKTLPTKQQQFLVLHTKNNLIYLEKRPPTGLWGGLWCLPSVAAAECPHAFISEAYKLQIENIRELMTFNHSFSHFHLQIKALAIQTIPESHSIAEHPGRWFSAQEIESVGMAKPISKIINYFLKPQLMQL